MNRTQKFVKNSVSTALLQIITLAVGLVLPRVMLSAYGSEINGLVTSISQFISYFNLVEAGLAGAAIYALYKPLANKDHAKTNSILTATKRFYTKTGYIFSVLVVGLAVFYPFYIKADSISGFGIASLVFILGVSTTLDFFTLSKYRALLTADQKTYVISYASIIQIILNTLIVVVLAKLNVDVVIVRFVALASILVRSVFLLLYCRRKYPYLDYTVKPDNSALNKRWDAFYLQIFGTVQMGAPTIILTLVLKDLKLISVYSIYNMVIIGLHGLMGIFTNGIQAGFGEIIACDEKEILKKSYKEFELAHNMTATCLFTVAFITIMAFVSVYTKGITDTNYYLPAVGFLFVLNGLLYRLKILPLILVESSGRFKEIRVQATIEAALVVILGIVFAIFWGIEGVLVAAVISNVYRIIDLMFFVPKNIVNISKISTIKRIVTIFVCVGLSFIPTIFIKYEPTTLFNWTAYAAIVSFYVVAIVVVVNFITDRKDFLNLINRFKSIVLKK